MSNNFPRFSAFAPLRKSLGCGLFRIGKKARNADRQVKWARYGERIFAGACGSLEPISPRGATTGKVCGGLCRLLGPCGLGAPCGVACASELAKRLTKLPDPAVVTIWLIHAPHHLSSRLAACC